MRTLPPLCLALALAAAGAARAQERFTLQDEVAGSVGFAAFSADGKWLVSGARLGRRAVVWEVATGRRVAVLQSEGAFRSAAFTPDGQVVLTQDALGRVQSWSAGSGQPLTDFSGPTAPSPLPLPPAGVERGRGEGAATAALAPDGRAVVTSGPGGLLELWETPSGKKRTLQQPTPAWSALALSPDGRLLAAGARAGGVVTLWDVAGRKRQAIIAGHDPSRAVADVLFAPGGRVLASRDSGGEVRLWDVAAGRPLATLAASGGPLAFAPDGRSLVAGTPGGVRRRGLDGKELPPLAEGVTPAALAFVAGGRLLATRTAAGDARLWNADPGAAAYGKEAAVLARAAPAVTALALTPDGRVTLAGAADGSLRRWDVATGREQPAFAAEGEVRRVLVSADGRAVAALTERNELRVWDAAAPAGPGRAAEPRATFTDARTAAFSPDGKLLAVGTGAGAVRLWAVAGGADRAALAGHPGPVLRLSWTRDGKLLASGGPDGVRLWDVSAGRERARLPDAQGPLLSPDGRWLAAAAPGGAVKLWAVPGPEVPSEGAALAERATFPAAPSALSDARFGPDSATFFVRTPEGVRPWGLAAGAARPALAGTGPLELSPDGRWLAVADAAGEVRVWDARARAPAGPRATLPGAKGPVRLLAFAPDGNALAVAGAGEADGRVWDLTPLGRAAAGAAAAPTERGKFPAAPAALFGAGRALVLGGGHAGVRVWDALGGRERRALLPPAGVATALAAAGGRLFTGHSDGAVRVWETDPRAKDFGRERRAFAAGAPVEALLASADGRLLAVRAGGAVRVWGAEDGAERAALAAREAGEWPLAFSADGLRLATRGAGGAVTLWDAGTGRGLGALPAGGVVASDGRRLAAGHDDGLLRVSDVAPGAAPATLQPACVPVTAAAFSPDGRVLATGNQDGGVRLWEVPAGAERAALAAHTRPVGVLAFSADGRVLGTREAAGAAWHFWDVATGRPRGGVTLASPQAKAYLAPDGATLAAFAPGGPVELWDTAGGKRRLTVHEPRPGSLSFMLLGKVDTLAAASGPDVKVWDAPGGAERVVHTGHKEVAAIAMTGDGKLLATVGGADATGRLSDAATGKELAVLTGHTGLLRHLAFAPDGKTLVTEASDQSGKLWDSDPASKTFGKERGTLPGLKALNSLLRFSPDGKMLATLGERTALQVWDVATGRRLDALDGHEPSAAQIGVEQMEWAGGDLVTRSGGGTVRAWRPGAGRPAAVLHQAPGGAPLQTFTADGAVYGLGAADGSVLLSSTATGAVKAHFRVAPGLAAMLLSPDSTALATRHEGGDVRLWEAGTGKERGRLAHPRQVDHMLFTPDGRTLATVDAEGVVRLWSAADGAAGKSFAAGGAIGRCIYAPGGRLLVGTVGETVRLWDADPASKTFGRELKAIPHPWFWAFAPSAFSPDGRVLATWGRAWDTKLWDADPASKTFGRELKALTDGAFGAFVGDGKSLVAVRREGNVVLFDADRASPRFGEEKAVLGRHPGANYLAPCADPQAFITGSGDGLMKYWDLPSARERASQVLPGVRMTSRGSGLIAEANADGTARLWEAPPLGEGPGVPPLRQRHLIGTPSAPATALAVAPGGATVAVGLEDGGVKLTAAGGGAQPVVLRGHEGPVNRLEFRRDGAVLASAGADGAVRLWDVAEGKIRATFAGEPGAYADLHWSRDGSTLLARQAGGAVRMWDVAGGRTRPLAGHAGMAGAVLTRDGKHVLTAGRGGTLELWDVGGARRATLVQARGAAAVAAWSPDGKALAVGGGGAEGGVSLWAAETGAERRLEGHAGPVKFALFAADGRSLVTAAGTETKAWDVAGGAERLTVPNQSPVIALAVTPDGRSLAVGAADGQLRLWDVREGPRRATLQGSSTLVTSVAFSGDGRLVAVGPRARIPGVRVWDAATGEVRLEVPGNGAVPALSPDGATLAVWHPSGDGTVRLWDVAAGRERGRVGGPFVCPAAPGQHAGWMQFSPDGKLLALRGVTGQLRLRDLATGADRLALTGTQGHPRFSRDGKLLAIGDGRSLRLVETATGRERPPLPAAIVFALSRDGALVALRSDNINVRLFDLATGEARATLTGHQNMITYVAFTPDGKSLVSYAPFDAPDVRVWDAATGREVRSLTTGQTAAAGVAVAPEGGALAAALPGGSVKLWDVGTGRERLTLRPSAPDNAPAEAVVFSRDGRALATAHHGGVVRLWSAAPARELRALAGHTGPVHAVAAGGSLVASGGADRVVRLWDGATGRPRHALTGHAALVLAAALSRDGRLLASGDGAGVIRVWDAAAGRERFRLTGHAGAAWALAFAPDGKTLASGGGDGFVRLWDAEAGKELRSMAARGGAEVLAVAFSPDGKVLASGEGDPFGGGPAGRGGAIRLWDAATGQERATLAGHALAVRGLAFAPDGKTLASGGDDRAVRLWDTGGRAPQPGAAPRGLLRGHTQAVVGLAFTPDGRTLLTAGSDPASPLTSGEVLLWDVAAGRPRPSLAGHRRGLTGVVCASDGRSFLAGSFDETVRWWALEEGP
jgi:WD40 repeat protein